MKRRATEDLSLPGVLSRIVSGFADSYGVVDLELTKVVCTADDPPVDSSEHLILRKQWAGAGGPRILLLKASSFTPPLSAAQLLEGWFEDADPALRSTAFADADGLMPAGQVRCFRELQCHALTPGASKMCASFIVAHACAEIEKGESQWGQDDGAVRWVHVTLRLFSGYPPTTVSCRAVGEQLRELCVLLLAAPRLCL